MAILSVSIRKYLGDFTLAMDFETSEGILALFGASGSGKSMTLKCIAGIETPDEGRIVLDGQVLFDSEKKINLSPQKREVGYLFQNYALFPNMTARQNIEAGIKGKAKVKRSVSDEKIQALYLNGLEDKYPHQLSGGQQQRVALARILANSPRLILLDEPFSALDSYLKWQLEMELIDTLRDYGGMALYVSHNRDEVYRICDHVCVIDNGRAEPVAQVKKMFQNPGTLTACQLSGCKNYTRVEPKALNRFWAMDWGVELTAAEEVGPDIRYAGIRAHSVYLAEETDASAFACRVLRVSEELFGMTAMLEPVNAQGNSEFSKIRLECAKESRRSLDGKEIVFIKMAPENLLLLR